MKVHNYGNDYAYQMKQKSREKEAEAKAEEVKETEKEVEDADHQIQPGGEGNLEGAQEENIEAVEQVRRGEEGVCDNDAGTSKDAAATSKRKKKAKETESEDGEVH